MTDKEDVKFKEIPGVGGNLGMIILNRPQNLNAITHSMCILINQMLIKWATVEHIKAIVIMGVGDRAFSAGGDIKYLYHQGKAQNYQAIRDFFSDEYRLNHHIHHYPKPFIALLDGLTMGGGVGVAIHGSHRVVTEHFLFAMPETAVGFFPNIGSSYFLSRCPGEIGIYLGLTGARLNAAEAIYAEIADHLVSSNHLNELIDHIAQTNFGKDPFGCVTEVLNGYTASLEACELKAQREFIDDCFCFDTIEEVMSYLKANSHHWYRQTFKELLKKSPTSLKISLMALRKGIGLDFNGCMQMEFRICQRLVRHHDFYEGVRAVLIDKDNEPMWQPNRLSEISEAEIKQHFESLTDGDLDFGQTA